MARLYLRFTSLPEPSAGEREGEPQAGKESSAQVAWLVLDDEGAVDSEGLAAVDELDGVEAVAKWRDDPSQVVVFLPVAETLALSCNVPGRNAEQMRRAAPYAIEEFIAEDIETMHVACATVARNEPVRCLVTPRATIEAYLACLSSAGIAAGYVTADAVALPAQANTATLLHEGQGTVLLRTFDQAACVDEPNVVATLEGIHDGLENEDDLKLQIVNAAASTREWPELALLSGAIEQVPLEGSLLSHLASAFDEGEAINLLQGEFAVKRRSGGAWERWRSVAAAVGAWLLVALILVAVESFWADRQADAARQSAEQLYKDIYDVQRVPGNPALRMRSRLGQAPVATTGFHTLTAHLGLSLQDIAGGFDLERLTYNERNGLGAEVVVSGYEAVEALQQALAGRGYSLDVVSAEQREQRVWANLRITAE